MAVANVTIASMIKLAGAGYVTYELGAKLPDSEPPTYLSYAGT